MKVRLRHDRGVPIVECLEGPAGVEDAHALIAACLEHGATRLLIESQNLPAAFFDLRSGFAGELVQKLQNYRIRLAGVFPADDGHGKSFRAFLAEARRGRSFRAFSDRSEAEAWLASEETAPR